MKHGSLFSGIGGFDLAAQWAGWDNMFQVEIDPFCRKVLKKNFPDVAKYEDIKKFDGEKYANTIDVISGGFPCQPFSVAGKQQGKKDARYLWPEMLRVISEIRPTWIICENVTGIINLGLEQVLADMESEGYEVQSLIIPACAKNAPHRRDRVWIIGHSNQLNGDHARHDSGQIPQLEEAEVCRLQAGTNQSKRLRNGRWNEPWIDVATRIHRMDDGLPRRMDKVNRLRALGNAIVPQIVFQIMQAINNIEGK